MVGWTPCRIVGPSVLEVGLATDTRALTHPGTSRTNPPQIAVEGGTKTGGIFITPPDDLSRNYKRD